MIELTLKHCFIFFLACCLPLTAAEQSIELDPARTTISFTFGDVLHTVHGTFKLKRAALKFDSATGQATGEMVVDVASGESGGGGRDKRMHKEILESARYPEAIFTADHIQGALAPYGESQLDLHGNFQLHGESHEMTLHFRAQTNTGKVTASTGFVIPYVQLGLKNPSNFLLKVSDKVELNIQATGRVLSVFKEQ